MDIRLATSRLLGRHTLDSYMGQHLNDTEIATIYAQNHVEGEKRGMWKYGMWMDVDVDATNGIEQQLADKTDDVDGIPALERG